MNLRILLHFLLWKSSFCVVNGIPNFHTSTSELQQKTVDDAESVLEQGGGKPCPCKVRGELQHEDSGMGRLGDTPVLAADKDREEFQRVGSGIGSIGEKSARRLGDTPVLAIENPCKLPEKPENGKIVFNNEILEEALNEITYVCDPNFILLGEKTRYCHNGDWSGEAPVCKALSCYIQNLKNAEIDSEEEQRVEYSIGESVDVKCLPSFHYDRKSSFHLICMDDGNWDIPLPVCEAVQCERPESIENGQINVDRKKNLGPSFSFGDQISYKCNKEFRLVGNEFQWCQAQGWSGSPPTCQAIVCTDFPEIENGAIKSKKDIYFPGEEVEVQCHMGHRVSGNSRAYLVCSELGVWNTSHSNCATITCKAPKKPENGFYEADENTALGTKDMYEFLDKLSFSCDYGYILVGKKLITCREEGWADPIPSCDAIVCRRPSDPANGWILGNEDQQIFNFQDKIVYQCSDLYNLVGNSERTCTERGWTGNTAECKLRGCPPPNRPGVAGMFYEFRKKMVSVLEDIRFIPFKETFGIICPKGFKKSMPNDPVCQPNGQWTRIPNCVVIECTPPRSTLKDGTIVGLYEQRTNKKYPFEHEISYYCNPDFRLNGSQTRICGKTGWEPNPLPTCEAIRCHRPDWISNGRIDGLYQSLTLKYNLNFNISYHCNYGFRLEGEKDRICKENGWFPEDPPTCKAVLCPQVAAISYGHIIGLYDKGDWSYEYPLNHTLAYECTPGYRLVGPQTRTCGRSGWSPSQPPLCEVIVCPQPEVENGFFSALTKLKYQAMYPGGTIHITCNANYRPIGNQVIQCTENGSWNDTFLNKCQELRTDCGYPGSIANGNYIVIRRAKTGFYPIDSQVKYKCHPGYQLFGSKERICTFDGWTGDTPSCLKLCETPREIEHGMLYKEDQYKVGSEANYKCSSGFELQPHGASLRCTENGWVGPELWCKKNECLEPALVNNSLFSTSIQPRLRHDEVFTYEVGAILTYTCRAPYQLNGEPNLHCLPSGLWSSDAPECESPYCTKPDVRHSVPVSSHFKYNAGDQFGVECLQGFRTSFSEKLVCLPEGTWDPPDVTCEEVVCSPPPAIMAGEYVPSKKYYKFGESVSYRCPGDHVQVEENRDLSCTDNGWTGELPKCVSKGPSFCPCPGNFFNDHEVKLERQCGSQYEVGESVSVVCGEEYKPIGNPQDIRLICTPHGNWSADNVRCIRRDYLPCPEPPKVRNGYLLGLKEKYDVGDSLTIVCRPGYSPANGTELLLCLPGSKWDDNFSDCEAVFCKPPDAPANGGIEYREYGPNDRWPFYSEASFTCAPGFQLVGHHWIKCLQSGWSSRTPICKEITCSDPGTPESGWKNGDSFAVGARVQFSCFDGYKLHGPKERICLKNGQWSDEQPYCHTGKTDCPGLATPTNGFKSRTHYNENDVVTFTCHSDYMLVGSQTRKCLDGTWSGTTTYCVGKNQFDRKEEVSQKFQVSLRDLLKDHRNIPTGRVKKPSSNNHVNIENLVEQPQPANAQHMVVYLLWDSSSSIGKRNFQRIKDFSKTLINKLHVSKNGTRVGLITFSSRATTEFYPSDFYCEQNVLDAIDRIVYREGTTSLQAALEILGDMMKETEETLEGGVGSHHVFLITDGRVNSGVNPVGTANKLKERFGATFTCLSVTGQWRKQILYSIATNENNIFYLDSFSTLDWLREDIQKGTVDYSKCGRGLDKLEETESSEQKEWPWTVYLLHRGKHYCRGTIISSEWVLTSGRCVVKKDNGYLKAEDVSLRIGVTGEDIESEVIHVHPKYNSNTSTFNAALIRLKNPVSFSEEVRPVCLPTSLKNTNSSLYAPGEFGYASSKSQDHLHHIPFPLQRSNLCAQALHNCIFSTFCAGDGKEYLECRKGDCGGSLIQYQLDSDGQPTWIQIGITNYLVHHMYSYFTDVLKITDWIETHI